MLKKNVFAALLISFVYFFPHVARAEWICNTQAVPYGWVVTNVAQRTSCGVAPVDYNAYDIVPADDGVLNCTHYSLPPKGFMYSTDGINSARCGSSWTPNAATLVDVRNVAVGGTINVCASSPYDDDFILVTTFNNSNCGSYTIIGNMKEIKRVK